jgi:hypothetical protein
MAQATKQFKFGESVIGGIIRVIITGKIIQIKFQDYYTKEDVVTGTVQSNQEDARRQMLNFLEENGTPYYAGKVMDWIESKVDLKSESVW